MIVGRDGTSFAPLANHLVSLTPALHEVTQNQLAYPILSCFGNPRRAAIGPLVAVLDEAVTILHHGVASETRLARGVLQPLREAIDGFLDDSGLSRGQPSVAPPPAPSHATLGRAGIPIVDDPTFEQALERQAERRSRLRAMLRDQGWAWPAVAVGPARSEPRLACGVEVSDSCRTSSRSLKVRVR